MTYPDEWEKQVEAMAFDLAAAGEPLPESIRQMNEAATRTVASGHFTRSFVAEAIFGSRADLDQN